MSTIILSPIVLKPFSVQKEWEGGVGGIGGTGGTRGGIPRK